MLLDHFALDDPALGAIAGIAMTAPSDDERPAQGAAIFDGLLSSFAGERRAGTE